MGCVNVDVAYDYVNRQFYTIQNSGHNKQITVIPCSNLCNTLKDLWNKSQHSDSLKNPQSLAKAFACGSIIVSPYEESFKLRFHGKICGGGWVKTLFLGALYISGTLLSGVGALGHTNSPTAPTTSKRPTFVPTSATPTFGPTPVLASSKPTFGPTPMPTSTNAITLSPTTFSAASLCPLYAAVSTRFDSFYLNSSSCLPTNLPPIKILIKTDKKYVGHFAVVNLSNGTIDIPTPGSCEGWVQIRISPSAIRKIILLNLQNKVLKLSFNTTCKLA